jgi:hypothetical protein
VQLDPAKASPLPLREQRQLDPYQLKRPSLLNHRPSPRRLGRIQRLNGTPLPLFPRPMTFLFEVGKILGFH